MTTSFKKESGHRPTRYRTPSPPRDVIERISPTVTAYAPFDTLWTQHAEASTGVRSASLALSLVDHKAHQHGYISTGSMDAFASIALAIQPNPPTLKRTVNSHYNAERPSKRARSEKMPSPDWSRKRAVVDTRPATSYEQSLESKLLEAELLLNFSQCARRASASSAIPQASEEHARDTMEHLSNGLQESPSQIPFPELEDVAKDETIGDWRAELQNASQMHGDIDEMTVTVGPERGIQSFSRLPMAAGSEQHEDVSMTREEASADAKIADTVQAMDGGREMPNGMDRSEEGPESPSPATKIARAEKDSSLPQTNEEVSFQLTHTATDVVEPENARQDNEPPEAAETPRHDEEDVLINESRVIHGALGENASNTNELSVTDAIHAEDNIPNINESLTTKETTKADGERSHLAMATATCAACNFSRNSLSMDSERNATSWISCDGCKSWYHFACAGFKNEREVRSVDKYRCRKCKPVHGSTTYVRKSSRAHSAIDYAGLHQGVIKTSDERPEHHYIQPIKDGIITFLPETFARMRPELVTAEYFEKGVGMKEPTVIPASFNPRPWTGQQPSNAAVPDVDEPHAHNNLDESSAPDDWFPGDPDLLTILDEGQDALDMVMPRGLTVRQVAELYGPEEKVEVIDVKSQNGEQKKWNMRRWVDYYEDQHEKVVRNVISLEVSHSKLGRLIRRPKIVRELDLQDSVWPEELLAKGEYPRVQFYCLMSVADCFTDFHIDFGGSSVFYHILKGKKTFLFIPPKEKNLKKYEEWCMSPAQNWTFLADQTKECYRVDLSEGDTMLIPAGWIHAVWTPEDSLVIGGNFLTRMNFAMQLRVAQIEKATGVGRKFRYPHFQKLHWYTALRYLEDDPLPASVRDLLEGGGTFDRDRPTHYDFDAWGENSRTGSENYHTRYYSQSELDGLPDLVRYLLRTALIDIGSITDGITVETRNAVKKSIPRGHRHGEPLEVVKRFAVWCAWKRGNEPIPHWAYPDAVPESVAPDKLSAAATKRLDREAALSAPRRQSARMQAQQQVSTSTASAAEGSLAATGDLVEGLTPLGVKQMSSQADVTPMDEMRRPRIAPGTSMGSHRKTACESCRKRRRACKHKDQVEALMSSVQGSAPTPISTDMEAFQAKLNALGGLFDLHRSNTNDQLPLTNDGIKVVVPQPSPTQMVQNGIQQQVSDNVVPATPEKDAVTVPRPVAGMGSLAAGSGSPVQSRPRTKACSDCRKSKRRCIHDENGNEDPVKVAETAIPRPHARKSNIHGSSKPSPKRPLETMPADSTSNETNIVEELLASIQPSTASSRLTAPVANMIAVVSSEPSVDHGAVPGPSLDTIQVSPPDKAQTGPSNFEARDVPHSNKELKATAELPNSDVEDLGLSAPPLSDETANEAVTHTASKDDYEQAAASSLVSPPASSHEDFGNSPMEAEGPPTHSSPFSRHSSQAPKQQSQRYTPESGPMRSTSSSSYDEHKIEEESSAKTQPPPSASKSGGGARLSSETVADEESLRLIKELQAQDLGLRRRGRT